MTSALVLSLVLAPPFGPLCAEGGATTMDPRLEHALRIRTRVRVREPARPAALVARKERTQ